MIRLDGDETKGEVAGVADKRKEKRGTYASVRPVVPVCWCASMLTASRVLPDVLVNAAPILASCAVRGVGHFPRVQKSSELDVAGDQGGYPEVRVLMGSKGNDIPTAPAGPPKRGRGAGLPGGAARSEVLLQLPILLNHLLPFMKVMERRGQPRATARSRSTSRSGRMTCSGCRR